MEETEAARAVSPERAYYTRALKAAVSPYSLLGTIQDVGLERKPYRFGV